MRTIHCDVLVVGAGPAGSSAARKAASLGADTLLLDRREAVGAPVQCAEYLPAQLVGELDLGREAQREFIAQPIEGMKTFLPDGQEHLTPAKGFVIHRDRFDRCLCKAAVDAGAELMLGTPVVGREKGGAVLAAVRGQGEPSLAIRARVVIGADGPRSTVASWVGASNPNLLPGVQFTLPLTGPEEFTEIYFEPDILAGYGWFFPKKDRVNIGLGMRMNGGESPKKLLTRFKDRFVAQGRVEDRILSRAGGWIPAKPVDQVVHGNVLLAGDAAGHTHPITGAGIFAAVTCGGLAGEYAALAAIEEDDTRLAEYDEEWRDLFEDSLNRAVNRRADMEANWTTDVAGLSDTVRRTWVAFREYYA